MTNDSSDQSPSQTETLKWLKSKITKDYTSVDLEVVRTYAEADILSGCDVSIVGHSAFSTGVPFKVTWSFSLVEVAIFSNDKAYKDIRSAAGAGAVVFKGRDGKDSIQSVVIEGESSSPKVSKVKYFQIPFASSSLAERVAKALVHARSFCFTDANREPF